MYPFKSLDIAVGFEDRVYTMGEGIDLSITLSAKRGTNIRGLVVELVSGERWSHLAFLNERQAKRTVHHVQRVHRLHGRPGHGREALVRLQQEFHTGAWPVGGS